MTSRPSSANDPQRPGHRAWDALRLRAALRGLFALRADTDEAGAIREITEGVEFRGGTLWALVFAIVIASVGLNVNSTAVIIGAMLISPLMGPIMGAGLGLGINDAALLRRSVRNLSVAATVSILTSTLYFLLSPLAEAQSELLARTRPTIYDVLIALAGGSAGIMALTRRGTRGNVVPGVAIATALMPPLCTAGYGLATRSAPFFFGALYLFLINSVLICFATLGAVRLLGFHRVTELDPAVAQRQRYLLAAAMALTIIPSVVVAWQVVRESRFDATARRFIAEKLQGADHAVVGSTVRYGRDSSLIDVVIVGRPLPADGVAALQESLESYGLARTRLVLHQPEEGVLPEQLGAVVRTGILEDLYRKNEEAVKARDTKIALLERELLRLRQTEQPMSAVARELAALAPGMTSLLYGTAVGIAPGDSARAVVVTWQVVPSATERARVARFLATRLGIDSLAVTHVRADARR